MSAFRPASQSQVSHPRRAIKLWMNPPKAHLPGKGASCPPFGEGGCPFEPGRVRGTHFSAGDVGVPTFHPSQQMSALRRVPDGPLSPTCECGLGEGPTTTDARGVCERLSERRQWRG